MANSAIIIGQWLTQEKPLVKHGQWQNWLDENFKLKKSTTANFMAIAERFRANSKTSWDLNFSQMWKMLALPAGTEENFIADMEAEGKPVENI